MAGGGESQDNPVSINVVPMVDVIFCLCVFFMCCFQLRQHEGRFESWLPKDMGGTGLLSPDVREIRVAMYWDETAAAVRRCFGARFVPDDAELEQLIADAAGDARASGTELPVIIDADARVPWSEVVTVVNSAHRHSIAKIQFALGAAPPLR